MFLGQLLYDLRESVDKMPPMQLQKKLRCLHVLIQYPAQPYKNLPSFVSAFDIETIPFLLNEVTEATSPVKLFEYMASSKPIITSVLPECKKYQSILLYDDAESFILQVEKAIGFKPDDLYYSVLEKEALENTWQIRVEKILNNL
jgi:hypothetical protein